MAAVSTVGRATQIEPTVSPNAAAVVHGLYERHADAIFRYALAQLRSRAEAEDAVQTTFLYAFRAIGRGVVPRVEIAWLVTIAKNVCRTMRENAGRRNGSEFASDPHTIAQAAPAPERRADELVGLEEALRDLPASQRRAVLLREWQGLSYREIASTMGLSQAAVETLLFRARRSLAESLEGKRERRGVGAAHAFDLGWLGWLKGLFGGASVAKLAAGTATVATIGVLAVGGDPVEAARETPPVARPGAAAVVGASRADAKPSGARASTGRVFRARRGVARSAGTRSRVPATPRPRAAEDAPAAAGPGQEAPAATASAGSQPSSSPPASSASESEGSTTDTTSPISAPTVPDSVVDVPDVPAVVDDTVEQVQDAVPQLPPLDGLKP